jgi:hypothetical protein
MRSGFQTFIWIVAGLLISAAPITEALSLEEPDLTVLARQRFRSLSPGEAVVFEEFCREIQAGQAVDFTPSDVASRLTPDPSSTVPTLRNRRLTTLDDRLLADPIYSDLWGRERTIKSDWISWLCRDHEASAKVPPQGITLIGARVTGPLNLAWTNVPFPIRLWRCAITGDIELTQAMVCKLELTGTYMQGLFGNGLTVNDDALLAGGFIAAGYVQLGNAKIHGDLRCDGSRIRSDLDATSAEIAGNVLLRNGFMAEGRVVLRAATIGRNLDCGGGQFEGPELTVGSGTIRGSVSLAEYNVKESHSTFKANGNIVFESAQISGNFDFGSGAEWRPAASLDLRNARAQALSNQHEPSWPGAGHLHLQGFTYNVIDLGNAADGSSVLQTQLKWLHLQPDGNFGQPYKQLATTFRNMGREAEAVQVLMTESEDAGNYELEKDWHAMTQHEGAGTAQQGPWSFARSSLRIYTIWRGTVRWDLSSDLVTMPQMPFILAWFSSCSGPLYFTLAIVFASSCPKPEMRAGMQPAN